MYLLSSTSLSSLQRVSVIAFDSSKYSTDNCSSFLVAASNASSHLCFNLTTRLARWSSRYCYFLYVSWYALLIVECCLSSIGDRPRSGVLFPLSVTVIQGAGDCSVLGLDGLAVG